MRCCTFVDMSLLQEGVYMVFEPYAQYPSYTAYLYNHTSWQLIYTVTIETEESGRLFKLDGQLKPGGKAKVGAMARDALNTRPVINFDLTQETSDRMRKRVRDTFKLKAKAFLSQMKWIAGFDVQSYAAQLTTAFNPDKEEQGESLAEYAKRTKQEQKEDEPQHSWLGDLVHYGEANPSERAHFDDSIDLHIESLRPDNFRGIKSEKILEIQLRECRQYLNDALRLKMDRVYIVHGLGKGRLKGKVAALLDQMPEVKSHRNEYNSKFGFGATEVEFYY